MKFIAAKNGQKCKFNELRNYYNVTTSGIIKIAESWGLNIKELNEKCSALNPEMVIYIDDTTPVLNTKNHKAYFANPNFLYEITTQ